MILYILESVQTGRYYVGATQELSRRLSEHNDPAANPSLWTRRKGPWKLVYSKEFASPTAALRAEKFVKRMKSRVFIERLIRAERDLDAFESSSKEA